MCAFLACSFVLDHAHVKRRDLSNRPLPLVPFF